MIAIIFCVRRRHNRWRGTCRCLFVAFKIGPLACVYSTEQNWTHVEGLLKARFNQPHCEANVELALQLSGLGILVACPTTRLRHTHTHTQLGTAGVGRSIQQLEHQTQVEAPPPPPATALSGSLSLRLRLRLRPWLRLLTAFLCNDAACRTYIVSYNIPTPHQASTRWDRHVSMRLKED